MYHVTDMPVFVALLPLVIGLLSCFWGYSLFRVIIGIVGFVLAGYLAGLFAYGLTGGSMIVTVIAAIAGAFIGAALITVFYFVGIFAIGALGGWMLGGIALGMARDSTTLVIGIALAALGGILAVIFQRIIIIVTTACIGSWNIISGLYFLATRTLYSPYSFWNPWRMFRMSGVRFKFIFVLWLLLSIAGIVFQLRFGRKKKLEKSRAT